ncbi:MAG TPA: ABC transporter ATP-binding protein [Bacteroidetes bacterium]|nr:ABC transporter ATP-binding protein [Bacteroidota bacterium]HIL57475.1 ABC transporter ATP-binding protein [Rhodothermales bacterium]
MIHVEGVHVGFDGREILHGVTFAVEPGRVAGYIGPNGAGKTTTMRLLTGTLQPGRGRVVVGGVDIAQHPVEAKRRFGFVPEHGHLYESFSPEEYLRFIGRMHGMGERTLERRAAAFLSFWGLAEAARQPMAAFSKGMKQKVLISAAVLHHPPVLLLDEPLSGLDAYAVLQVRALLRALAGQGTTVFYSSHLLDAVEKVADQVLLIRDGSILADGTPAEILRQAGEGSLEGAFSRLTSASDAEAEARALVADAFGEGV